MKKKKRNRKKNQGWVPGLREAQESKKGKGLTKVTRGEPIIIMEAKLQMKPRWRTVACSSPIRT